MKRALVCGAGGFIAGHLVKRLKADGYWVRGVDIKAREFSPSAADEFLLLDLRDLAQCRQALLLDNRQTSDFDQVYQLAADMGGMGFIHSAECEIMRNNVLVNVNMIDAAATLGVKRYFYSSSVCIYRDMVPGEPELADRAGTFGRSRRHGFAWFRRYASAGPSPGCRWRGHEKASN